MAAAAAIPGLDFGPEVTYILAAILIVTGLALAFYGHGLWATVMSMIGALLGSAVGFLFGAALGGIVVGLILALVGAVIGSILFTKLVKVALAFLVGLLAAAVVYGLLGGQARFTEGSLDAALAIESRGVFHRPRRRARPGPGPGTPGDFAARPHDLRADPGSDPRVLRRGQGHPDRQRLRLRVPSDDLALRPRRDGRPRGRLPRRRELRGPSRDGRPREAGRAHAGGGPAPRARGPGVHVPPDDHINIGYAG